MMIRWNNRQIKSLNEALVDAFDWDSLERMLGFELNKRLDTLVERDSFTDVVFELVKIAQRGGWTTDLFEAAIRHVPNNPKLNALQIQLQNAPSMPNGKPVVHNRFNLLYLLLGILFCAGSVLLIAQFANPRSQFNLGSNWLVASAFALIVLSMAFGWAYYTEQISDRAMQATVATITFFGGVATLFGFLQPIWEPPVAAQPTAIPTRQPVPTTVIDATETLIVDEPVLPTETPTTSVEGIAHCDRPTTPVLLSPKDQGIQPNHYYGEGDPWEFAWLASTCDGGSVVQYQIVVFADGAATSAVDEFVTEPMFVGDTTGTISGRNWTWKVRALDDKNQFSEWSELYTFTVPEWEVIEVDAGEKGYMDGSQLVIEAGAGFIFDSLDFTSGVGADRDVWWNGVEFVPGRRMCSLGVMSSNVDLSSVTGDCVLKFAGFVPQKDEVYLLEIVRGQTQYALIRVVNNGCSQIPVPATFDCNSAIAFEWLYPFSP